MALDDRTPSARRFTRWAIALVLPLVASAAAMPWALEQLRATRGARPASRSGPDGATGPAADPGPPRHPEPPRTGEIEAAGAARMEAARLEQRHLERSTTFAPREARTTADGERVAPFQGFGLSIESTPAGARVLVGDRDVGETPIVTTVDCAAGREVEVRVEKRGFRTERRAIRCRADALLELSVPLRR